MAARSVRDNDEHRERLFRGTPPYTFRPLWLAIAAALYG